MMEKNFINKNTEASLADFNKMERKRAHDISSREFEERKESNPEPSDVEKRLGVYIEFLEPQIREAIVTLTNKGYATIDSGYDGSQTENGNQYIGFKKGTLNESILKVVQEGLKNKKVTLNIELLQRDFFNIIPEPKEKLTLEEWKEVWNRVAELFPMTDFVVPYKEKFISEHGH